MNKKLEPLKDLFQTLYLKLNGYNYTDYNDLIIFDFQENNYTYTLKYSNNEIKLANNVDVYDDYHVFIGNFSLEQIQNISNIRELMNYKYYLRIEYIDEKGLAHYIQDFDISEEEKAIEQLNILNLACNALNENAMFVIDKHIVEIDSNGYSIEGTDEIFEENITGMRTLAEESQALEKMEL